MNSKNIDIEKLRSDLTDYFGTAMFSGFPMAIVDLSDVERASAEELLNIATKNRFDLKDYEIPDDTILLSSDNDDEDISELLR